MNDEQRALYERLVAFEVDGPGVAWTFARRLAAENGWTVAYAERVILEYKRFVFLAMHVGHVVTPSEQVDQAWHLHLTYTRSYWEQLCRGVLDRPLHHDPTQGGPEERAKYKDLYARTLASYERFFGEAPPADIWSDVETRFGEDVQRVLVNTARHWVIPKPRWLRMPATASLTPMLALAGVGAPVVFGAFNPLNMRGQEFLLLYIVLMVVAAIGAMIARALLRPTEDLDTKDIKPLDGYEVACLASGADRVVDAALASMVQAKTLQLTEQKKKGFWKTTVPMLAQGEPLPAGAPEIENALYQAVAQPAENLAKVHAAGRPAATVIENSLIERGLVRAKQAFSASQLAALVMALPLLIGIPKIVLGNLRGKPVGYLVFLCFATVVVAILFAIIRSRLTAKGERVLSTYQRKYRDLRGQARLATLSPGDTGLMVGLFGATILMGSPLSPLSTMLTHHASSGGGDGGGGGCGGGGCGGGGCGGCGG